MNDSTSDPNPYASPQASLTKEARHYVPPKPVEKQSLLKDAVYFSCLALLIFAVAMGFVFTATFMMRR